MNMNENRTEILREFAEEVRKKYLKSLIIEEEKETVQVDRFPLYERIVIIRYHLENNEFEQFLEKVKNWIINNDTFIAYLCSKNIEDSLEYIAKKEMYKPLFDDETLEIIEQRLEQIKNGE